MRDDFNKRHINITLCYVNELGSLYNEEMQLPIYSTVRDALYKSSIILNIKNIDYLSNNIGIFGKLVKLDSILLDNDRVEVYRELLQDPKKSRIKRLMKKNNKVY